MGCFTNTPRYRNSVGGLSASAARRCSGDRRWSCLTTSTHSFRARYARRNNAHYVDGKIVTVFLQGLLVPVLFFVACSALDFHMRLIFAFTFVTFFCFTVFVCFTVLCMFHKSLSTAPFSPRCIAHHKPRSPRTTHTDR